MFSMVVAMDERDGIARDENLPWDYPEDRKIFKYLTTGFTEKKYKNNAIVMGYTTWISLKKRPLPDRKNIVISNKHFPAFMARDYNDICGGAEWYKSPEEFLILLDPKYHYWIIGGKQIYEWFISKNLISSIYRTKINKDYSCDLILPFEKLLRYCAHSTQFIYADIVDKFISDTIGKANTQPAIIHGYSRTVICKNIKFDYLIAQNVGEQQILNIIRDVLTTGITHQDRTGTGTISGFGYRAKFDLSSFPLMTSRPQSFRWIFEELMWVIRGQRDVGILEQKGINVWMSNSTQEFIDKQNLEIPLDAGDIGESYGYNMRNYNGADGQHYDQLAIVLDLLKNNPSSRRIIINLWHPAVKRAALPPCLCWYQFYVREAAAPLVGNNKPTIYLDCQAMNRSSDIVVAGGWNVTTAALLTYILAAACNYTPGNLIWITGDTHIYLNNIDAANELIKRIPPIYPKLYINNKISTLEDILSLEFTNLQLLNYFPLRPQIKTAMNI